MAIKLEQEQGDQPFMTNFQKELENPRVPGQYDPDKQVRVDEKKEPVVQQPTGIKPRIGILGTTRTGEHTQEC